MLSSFKHPIFPGARPPSYTETPEAAQTAQPPSYPGLDRGKVNRKTDWRFGTFLVALVILATACGGESAPDVPLNAEETPEATIDQRSYRLGSIGAFAEMVDAGVKELALSAAVDPVEMDAMIDEAERIVRDH